MGFLSGVYIGKEVGLIEYRRTMRMEERARVWGSFGCNENFFVNELLGWHAERCVSCIDTPWGECYFVLTFRWRYNYSLK